MTTIFLFAADDDPVASAIRSLHADDSRFREIDDSEAGAVNPGQDDVVLIGDGHTDFRMLTDAGLVQFLGCRPPSSLLVQAQNDRSQVTGISPILAPRVASRVIGFTGPLPVKPRPEWGIVGFGEVGQEVVKKVTATGATAAIAEIRTPRSGSLTDLGVRRNSLDLLVAGSDAISLHVHPGPTASPLISERELGLMKPEAVLINTADSSIVDETAVIAAIHNGEIGGYATDCPGPELLGAADSPTESGKLIITTNSLTNQIGAPQQIAKWIGGNIEAFMSGSPVLGKYDPVDFPVIGDPSFWSSRMSPRQD